MNLGQKRVLNDALLYDEVGVVEPGEIAQCAGLPRETECRVRGAQVADVLSVVCLAGFDDHLFRAVRQGPLRRRA